MSTHTRPIVVVTGANSGVGYGICQRLLHQLCQTPPSDARPQAFARHIQSTSQDSGSVVVYDGLTLILACRNLRRAQLARTQLYALLDRYVARFKALDGYAGHAERFRNNVDIEVQHLDLSVVASVFDCGQSIRAKYPYVSHLVCNAGLVGWSRLDWIACIKQLCTQPMMAVTAPAFNIQKTGLVSKDGLGWIWQCNFYGHYILFRQLESLLDTAPSGGRVIWSSSLEASPLFFDMEDVQLIKTAHSYEASKYQIDLVATRLDQRARRHTSSSPTTSTKTRHFISQPGVCSTNVAGTLIYPWLETVKWLSFYIARLCGSRYHPIDAFKAAIATTHLILVHLCFVTAACAPGSASTRRSGVHVRAAYRSVADLGAEPVRFGAETDRWGHEEVGITPVEEWDAHGWESEQLLHVCETLYDELLAKEKGRDECVHRDFRAMQTST